MQILPVATHIPQCARLTSIRPKQQLPKYFGLSTLITTTSTTTRLTLFRQQHVQLAKSTSSRFFSLQRRIQPEPITPCTFGLVYLSGIFRVGRGKYRPTTKSRKFPDGLFTCLVYFGNFPAHPRFSRRSKL
jgi:hypothetical protein